MAATLWIAFFRFHGLLLPPAAAPGGRPLLLLRRGLIWDADRDARARGIRPGIDAAAARTLCPEAEHRAFDPVAAAEHGLPAWDILAEAASIVEPDPDGRPEALAAWTTPSPPLPELRSVLEAVRRTLTHVDTAVGLGPNRLTARAACPAGAGFAAAAPGGEARLLAPLPLQALVDQGLLSPPLHRRLQGLDLHRCGQVAALPEAALQARFGREGVRLRLLCLGRDERSVAALHPPRAPAARRAFPDALPPGVWPEAAARLARQAGETLGPAEGARALVLSGAFGERRRTWKAPRRAAGVLARAAAELARQTAVEGGVEGTDRLEVRLEGISAIPIRPLNLLPPTLGNRPAQAEVERTARSASSANPPLQAEVGRIARSASGANPPRHAPRAFDPPKEIDDLLAQLPQGVLRRGAAVTDRYERLLSLLDPWRQAQ